MESKIGKELEGLMNEYQSLETNLIEYSKQNRISKKSLDKVNDLINNFHEIVGGLNEKGIVIQISGMIENLEKKIKKMVNYPTIPTENFIMNYDGKHKDYFKELIVKVNEKFGETQAEIPEKIFGEVKNMNILKRMAIISTISNNLNLQNQRFYPITPVQSESLFKAGKLLNPKDHMESLALLLYDVEGKNQEEALALKESITRHRTDLGLGQSDLQERLVVVNAGAEFNSGMNYGIEPIIIPGITQVYPHEILYNRKNYKFEYGSKKGLPSSNSSGGCRNFHLPDKKNKIGLRTLDRHWDLDLYARFWEFAPLTSIGRINFAFQE